MVRCRGFVGRWCQPFEVGRLLPSLAATLVLLSACSAGDTTPGDSAAPGHETSVPDTSVRSDRGEGTTTTSTVGASGVSDEALGYLASCVERCTVTGRIPMDHPTFGPIEVVTLRQTTTPPYDDCAFRPVLALDRSGAMVWNSGLSGEDGCFYYSFGPAGMQDYGSSVRNPVDRAGRVFLDWNPGRYNGVSVLVPTPDGFDDLDTLPLDDYLTRFYGSTVEDTDGDGAYEIVLEVVEYLGSVGFPAWRATFAWNGSDFAPRPETSPTECGHDVSRDGIGVVGPYLPEIRHVIVVGTTCFEVLTRNWPTYPNDPTVIEAIVRAHDRSGGSTAFEANGWRCEVSRPGADGAAYRCVGKGTLTFTRHTSYFQH